MQPTPRDDEGSAEGVPPAHLVAILSPVLFVLAFGLMKTDAADRLLGGGDAGIGWYFILSGPVALGTAWYLRNAARRIESSGWRSLTRAVAVLDVLIGIVGLAVTLFLFNSGIA
jgi:hypothetical protein